jgi:hypothetical protein
MRSLRQCFLDQDGIGLRNEQKRDSLAADQPAEERIVHWIDSTLIDHKRIAGFHLNEEASMFDALGNDRVPGREGGMRLNQPGQSQEFIALAEYEYARPCGSTDHGEQSWETRDRAGARFTVPIRLPENRPHFPSRRGFPVLHRRCNQEIHQDA